MVTAQEWIKQVINFSQDKYEFRYLFAEFDKKILQHFANNRDWQGLENFYEEVEKITFEKMLLKEISRPSVSFQKDIFDMLNEAWRRAQTTITIKAIYAEYFYDGDLSCSMASYLCQAFEFEDDNWASEFNGEEATINGPFIGQYFEYESNGSLDDVSGAIAESCANAYLLAEWGRVADKLSMSIPLGFARHNYPIINVFPKIVINCG